jgi:hypothetical protein
MDPFDDHDIALLLRLKRDEQPPASYYENFLSEFRRRQRDQLLRQSVLTICLERAQNFVLRLDVRSLAPHPAAIAAVLVCGAVVSIKIYQQPEPAQVTLQSFPFVPIRVPITDRELDFAPSEFTPAFDTQPAILRGNSKGIRMLPADLPRSDEFVPLKLKLESLDDQPVLEK